MEHNKFGLIEGETVILDKEFANRSRVVIVSISKLQMFSRVISEEDAINSTPERIQLDSWEVMTGRLSPLEK